MITDTRENIGFHHSREALHRNEPKVAEAGPIESLKVQLAHNVNPDPKTIAKEIDDAQGQGQGQGPDPDQKVPTEPKTQNTQADPL